MSHIPVPVVGAILGAAVLGWAAIRLLNWWSIRSILDWQEAQPVDAADPLWQDVQAILARLAKRARLSSCPELFILREYAPNAFVLQNGTRRIMVVSDGLVHALNSQELEAILSVCLSQFRIREFRSGPKLAFLLRPIVYVLELLPSPLFLLFSAIPAACVRLFSRPRKFFRADRLALTLCESPLVLAASLQKIGAVSKKVPLQNWSLSMDHLYLVSPMQVQAGVLHFFPSHPSIDDRVEKILRLRH